MKLKPGQRVPHFKLKDVFGRSIDLADYTSRKLLIAFFRHAGCPFCNLRVHALTKVSYELKAEGLDMLFFFESKESVILRSSFHRGVSPIPLFSDPEKIWYEKYGLEESFGGTMSSHLTSFLPTVIKAKAAGVPVMVPKEESFSTLPAEFLVGHGGILRSGLYSKNLNERLDLQEIRDFARS